jgi:hypothetical protein
MNSKRIVNITFQIAVFDYPWDEAPIVYVLEHVPENKDIEELKHCISVINNFATVRITHLYLSDPVTRKVACRYSAEYYQALPTFYNKPKK